MAKISEIASFIAREASPVVELRVGETRDLACTLYQDLEGSDEQNLLHYTITTFAERYMVRAAVERAGDEVELTLQKFKLNDQPPVELSTVILPQDLAPGMFTIHIPGALVENPPADSDVLPLAVVYVVYQAADRITHERFSILYRRGAPT